MPSNLNPIQITACILARNESARIEDAIRSLLGWTCQIIVIDNESTDDTAAIAHRYGATVLSAPPQVHFDGLRNLAIEHATGDWILVLDADERVPARLGPILHQMIRDHGDEFASLCIPFKHFFCGKWMEHSGWWPGYTRPQLLKKGKFRYNTSLHSGVQVDGPTMYFPADDPDLAIVHYSYDDLHHYLHKLNNYTDGEAASLIAAGQNHSWQAQLAHFVHDWQQYYEHGRADLDGMHGFVLSFMSAFYRFASRAKLWDLRRQQGETDPNEPVPASLREMLEFMARVTQEGAQPWLAPQPTAVVASTPVPLLWRSPLFDASGYADEARNFVEGLLDAGEPVALAPFRWGDDDHGLSPQARARFERCFVPEDSPAELCVLHTLLPFQQPHPNARFTIARTMFETDRLPEGAAARLNAMDRIWVPSEFNRETFVRAGVDPSKIAVVPGSIAPDLYAAEVEPWPLPGDEPFQFLSVFDWTLHKGWDVLLEAFLQEFGADTQVGLVLKVWSSNGYTSEVIREQANAYLGARHGKKLTDLPRIHFWQERVPISEMPRLYRAANAFVLATRGEGWCRPLMEAMASGLPTIATAWSGLTAFHNAEVGYPVKYSLVPVSAAGAREVPPFHGHQWAEPDIDDLRKQMRKVVRQPHAARKRGIAAQQSIAQHYSHAPVTEIVKAELAHCRALAQAKPAVQAPVHAPANDQHPTPNTQYQPPNTLPPTPHTPHPPQRPPANLVPLDTVPEVDFRADLGRPLRVLWEGPQAVLSSLALVNRELCLRLLASPDIELSIAEVDPRWHTVRPADDARFAALFALRGKELSGPPDVTIRHHFPPDWQRPKAGKLFVMQPWEYGHLPREWMPGALLEADEIWAYSRFVRDVYVRSGVPAEKIRVVGLGVRPDVFSPDGPRYPLQTQKTVRFLFVGGAIDRKGADCLLEAYLRTFTRNDDVCLVVKDMGTRTFYGGQTLADAFRRVQADPRAPEVVYLDDDLSEAELASLYRACTCVALPYRGEGFGLSPLEGMACGLPAIVTAGGPTDDYLDDSMALRVPYHLRSARTPNVGPFECVGDPWQLEPDMEALAQALRWVYDHPAEAFQRGEAGRRQVLAGWTWERSAALIRERMHALVCPASGRAIEPAKLWRGAEAVPAGGRGRPVASGKAATSRRSPKKVELTLCVIARDEEPRIGSCLRSAAPYVDEMIVVDTGSKDRTREIAAECGARVFDFPWVDSFSEARNQSLAQVTGKWIFWMDADDVLQPESGAMLRTLIRQTPGKDVAYQVQVRIPPGPNEFSASVVDHVKLFPRRPDLQFEFRIHEQILPSIRRAGLEIRFSDVYVVHQHYDRSPEGQNRKRLRDFRLLDLDLREHPNHPFILFNFGMTYLYATKEFEVAAHFLRRSLSASDWRDSIVRKAYALLVTARTCQLDWAAALAANEEGRSYYPDDAELLFQAGQVYQNVGRFDDAKQALEKLVSGQEDAHYRSVDTGLRSYRGRHELALLYRRMGDVPHCVAVLNAIAHEHPEYLPARSDLAETLQLIDGHQGAPQASFADSPMVLGPVQQPVRGGIDITVKRAWRP